MRAVDEMSSDSARMFESFCADLIGTAVPKCIRSSLLTFREMILLIEAGLIVDQQPGVVRVGVPAPQPDGKEFTLYLYDDFALGYSKGSSPNTSTMDCAPFQPSGGKPVMPVYLLTEAGKAISSFVPRNDEANFAKLYNKCAAVSSPGEPIALRKIAEGFERFSVAGDEAEPNWIVPPP